jgi:hypothetical protein
VRNQLAIPVIPDRVIPLWLVLLAVEFGQLRTRVYLEESVKSVDSGPFIWTSSLDCVTSATLQGISRMNATLICWSALDNKGRVALSQ